jgi:inosine/xanthosine triphosphatase
MPLSSDETLKGALNRAHAAIKNVAGADYGVGLEGGVHTTEYGTLLIGWAAIVSRDGRESVGGSPSIVLPEAIAKELKKGAELGPLMDKLYGTKGKIISHEKGTYGLLTQDRITRTEQFALALECAIAPFVNTKLYKK